MKNEKNIYASPSVEVLTAECNDVIATSGFNGGDHILGGGSKNTRELSFELQNSVSPMLYNLEYTD